MHGLDCGDEAAEWISNFLGKPYRIMKFSGSLPERKQNRDVAFPEWSKLRETETVSEGEMVKCQCMKNSEILVHNEYLT